MRRDLLPIGRVIKPHGVKGKMKVKYFGDNPKTFSSYRELIIINPEGRLQTYQVLGVVPQQSQLIVQLKGIERAEEVQPLTGREIFVNRESLPDLAEGEYYWADLLGMDVLTEEGKQIGRVKEIFSTGAHDVFIVEGKKGEIFLPAVENVIKSIDCEKGIMKVHSRGGLWKAEDEI
jgi:16S rRNA processing protein RimM